MLNPRALVLRRAFVAGPSFRFLKGSKNCASNLYKLSDTLPADIRPADGLAVPRGPPGCEAGEGLWPAPSRFYRDTFFFLAFMK